MNLDIETVLAANQQHQKNKERTKSRNDTKMGSMAANRSHLSKRPTISLVPRQSSMFQKPYIEQQKNNSSTKKAVAVRRKQPSQRYKEDRKDKHNTSTNEEQKQHNVTSSQQRPRHMRNKAEVREQSPEVDYQRQLNIAQRYQHEQPPPVVAQQSFRVRQELRPSTIEISTSVRLEPPTSQQGIIAKQEKSKPLYSQLSPMPNPVLAKPRDKADRFSIGKQYAENLMQDIIHGPSGEEPLAEKSTRGEPYELSESTQQHYYTIIKHDAPVMPDPRNAKQQLQQHNFLIDCTATAKTLPNSPQGLLSQPCSREGDNAHRRILFLQEANFKQQFRPALPTMSLQNSQQQTLQPLVTLPAVLLSPKDKKEQPHNFMTVSQPVIGQQQSNKSIPAPALPIYQKQDLMLAQIGPPLQYATLKQQQQKFEVRSKQVRTEIQANNEIQPLVSSRLEPRSLKRQRFSMLKLGNSPSQQVSSALTPTQDQLTLPCNPYDLSDSKRFVIKGKCKPEDPVEMRQEDAYNKVMDRLVDRGPRIHRAKPIRLQSIEFESPTHYRRQHQQLQESIERARNEKKLPSMHNPRESGNWIAVSPTRIGITKYMEKVPTSSNQASLCLREEQHKTQPTPKLTVGATLPKQASLRKLTPAQLHQLRHEKRRLGGAVNSKSKVYITPSAMPHVKTDFNVAQPIPTGREQISEESEYEDTVLYGVPKCDFMQTNSVVDLSKFVTKRDFCPKGASFLNTTAKAAKKLLKNQQLVLRNLPSCESMQNIPSPSTASLQQRQQSRNRPEHAVVSMANQQNNANKVLRQSSQRTLLANIHGQAQVPQSILPAEGVLINRKNNLQPIDQIILSIQTPHDRLSSRRDDETNSFDQSSAGKMNPVLPVHFVYQNGDISDDDVFNRKVVFQTTSSRPSGLPLSLQEDASPTDFNRGSELLPALKQAYGKAHLHGVTRKSINHIDRI